MHHFHYNYSSDDVRFFLVVFVFALIILLWPNDGGHNTPSNKQS